MPVTRLTRSRGGASGRLQTPRLALLLSCMSLTLCLGLLTMATVANALPPGWGYELISPADTGGTDIKDAIGSADDQHAWVSSIVPLSAAQGSGNLDVFAASRTSSGWHLQDLAEPFPADGKSYSYILQGRSPDASHSLVTVCERAALGCAGDTRYVLVGSDGSRTTELTVPAVGFGNRDPLLVAFSSDLSRIVIHQAAGPLVAQDTHTQGYGLYLAHDGQAEFLGVDENGAVLVCGAVLGNGDTAGFGQTGLSADGQTVAYTSPDPDPSLGCPETPEVYVHHDGHTFDISRPRNGNPDQGAKWVGSSQDGSTVFFTTTSQLITSDTDTANDIYAYHVATDTVTRITPGADVLQAQVSPDGDYIYFTATNPIGGQGTLGQGNLYLYHNGTTLIATAPNGAISVGRPTFSGNPSLATPDGRYLLFYSTAPLVGPPTNGNSQLFQYSTIDQQMRCISCHPDGTAPTTSTLLPGKVSPFQSAVDLRLQSDDGQTVVFETHERLLPEDLNDTLDIYLWQHGTLSLISSPRVPNDDGSLASTTATGNSVYFKSTDRLTPDAQQDNIKMYAARLGGGFSFPPPAPACHDDACQGPPTAPPNSPPPTSTTLGGLGNLIPAAAPALTKPAAKPLTNAQKLSRTLKACRSKRRGSARHRCESRARRHYPQAARRATHRHRGGTADASL